VVLRVVLVLPMEHHGILRGLAMRMCPSSAVEAPLLATSRTCLAASSVARRANRDGAVSAASEHGQG
jgi:hypothetical protein